MKDKGWCCDCKNLKFQEHKYGICERLNIIVLCYAYYREERKLCSKFVRKTDVDCKGTPCRFADCNAETCLQ